MPGRKRRLPLPYRFVYHALVAREIVKEFAKQPEIAHVDSIFLLGSSVRPRKQSSGKDIDLQILLKEGTKKTEKTRAEGKFMVIKLKMEEKYNVSLDPPWCHEARTRKGAGALRSIATFPHQILYAAKDSWGKYYLERRDKSRSLPRKRKTKPMARKPKLRQRRR